MLTKYPPWFVYKPDIHRVRGEDVRRVLDAVQPGDILLRRFDGYLNTIFTPGFWGHAGLYLGDNQAAHAVSQGCIEEDILNFCRADAVAVLRLIDGDSERVCAQAKLIIGMHVPYDFDFSGTNDTFYCTEFVDVCCDHDFRHDYTMVAGHRILTPDAIYHSSQTDLVIQVNYMGPDKGSVNRKS
jgi:uncharacterized protein YycO